MNGLRFIRIQCNYLIGELADKLGVSRQLVSSWEKRCSCMKRTEKNSINMPWIRKAQQGWPRTSYRKEK